MKLFHIPLLRGSTSCSYRFYKYHAPTEPGLTAFISGSEVMDLNCFIFDFDGTLAHSEGAYREAFGHSIRLHTGLEIDDSEFRDFWNLTPQQVLARYSEEMLEEMLVSFEEFYYANHHHHLIAYDGIFELLEYLNER